MKVGDVVVIYSEDGTEDRSGWLGVLHYDLGDKRWDVVVKDPTEPGVQGFLSTYHEDNFEVIDNVGPVQIPSIPIEVVKEIARVAKLLKRR